MLGNGTTVYANVALKPEKSDNVNLGLFGTWHPAGAHTLSYELNGFLRFVDDYIQATVSEKEGMMQYENVPAVNIKGMEGEVRYDFDGRLQLSANVSYQDARDQRKLKDDGKPSATYMNRVPNRPWLFSSSGASYTFHDVFLHNSRLRIGMDYQWVHWYFLTWEAYGARESKAKFLHSTSVMLISPIPGITVATTCLWNVPTSSISWLMITTSFRSPGVLLWPSSGCSSSNH